MTTPTDRERAITEKVDALASVLRPDWDMLDSTWGSFSCTEVEAVADVFRAAGYADFAATIIEGHSMHDEEEDEHYNPEVKL